MEELYYVRKLKRMIIADYYLRSIDCSDYTGRYWLLNWLTNIEIFFDSKVVFKLKKVPGLATDCPLDLHAREFKVGQCAQTRLARAGMTLSPLADGSGFEVIIRRSFADYLLLWLQDAAIAFE